MDDVGEPGRHVALDPVFGERVCLCVELVPGGSLTLEQLCEEMTARGVSREWLPERLVLDLNGVRVAMIHDSGARSGRENRMRRWFPDADVVVFGHSHDPVDAEGTDGQRLFNPGSPTQRRRQPQPSFGLLEVDDGRLTRHEIVRF